MAAIDVTHASNLIFVREIRVGTGWVYRTTSQFNIQGHTVQFGLGFNDELLRDAAFGFNDLSDLPAANRRETHDRFLASMLGVPSRRTPAATTYEFTWGTIESTFDPRTGQTDIIVTWS